MLRISGNSIYRNALLTGVCAILVGTVGLGAKTMYVSTSGSSSGDGTSFAKGYDIRTAIGKAAAGDTVLLQAGSHIIPNDKKDNSLAFSASGQSGKPICYFAETNKIAEINFGWNDNSKTVTSNAVTSMGLIVSGDYLNFRGINVTKSGYQGGYVTGGYINFENCTFHNNWNTGCEINKGGNHVTFLNCDAYQNSDNNYKNGGMADGFGPKQTIGVGCKFISCRSWDNSDDGYDCYDTPNNSTFENCWAFRNGMLQGNGNGFKVGGNDIVCPGMKLTNCIAFGNISKGFDQNSNMAGITVYNGIAYQNGNNFGMGTKPSSGNHVVKNCISLADKGSISIASGATLANNSWSSGFSVSENDFESLDTTLATIKRNPDGSLPETKLFRLKSTSSVINKGVDVGLPFVGSAPDLGAFEYHATRACPTYFKKTSFGITQSVNGHQLSVMFKSPVKSAVVTVFSLDGSVVIKSDVTSGSKITMNCASLTKGSYVSEIIADGVKQQVAFAM